MHCIPLRLGQTYGPFSEGNIPAGQNRGCTSLSRHPPAVDHCRHQDCLEVLGDRGKWSIQALTQNTCLPGRAPSRTIHQVPMITMKFAPHGRKGSPGLRIRFAMAAFRSFLGVCLLYCENQLLPQSTCAWHGKECGTPKRSPMSTNLVSIYDAAAGKI